MDFTVGFLSKRAISRRLHLAERLHEIEYAPGKKATMSTPIGKAMALLANNETSHEGQGELYTELGKMLKQKFSKLDTTKFEKIENAVMDKLVSDPAFFLDKYKKALSDTDGNESGSNGKFHTYIGAYITRSFSTDKDTSELQEGQKYEKQDQQTGPDEQAALSQSLLKKAPKIEQLINELDKVLKAPSAVVMKDINFDPFEFYMKIMGISKETWEKMLSEIKSDSHKCEADHATACKLVYDEIAKMLPYLGSLVGIAKSKMPEAGGKYVQFLEQCKAGTENPEKLAKVTDAYLKVYRLEAQIRAARYHEKKGTYTKESADKKVATAEEGLAQAKKDGLVELSSQANALVSSMKRMLKALATPAINLQNLIMEIHKAVQRKIGLIKLAKRSV